MPHADAAPDPELLRLLDDVIHRCYELGHTVGADVPVYQQDAVTLKRGAETARSALLAYLDRAYLRLPLPLDAPLTPPDPIDTWRERTGVPFELVIRVSDG